MIFGLVERFNILLRSWGYWHLAKHTNNSSKDGRSSPVDLAEKLFVHEFKCLWKSHIIPVVNSSPTSYLCRESILELQQVKIDVSNGTRCSTDDRMNCSVRLLQKVCQPILNVALRTTRVCQRHVLAWSQARIWETLTEHARNNTLNWKLGNFRYWIVKNLVDAFGGIVYERWRQRENKRYT